MGNSSLPADQVVSNTKFRYLAYTLIYIAYKVSNLYNPKWDVIDAKIFYMLIAIGITILAWCDQHLTSKRWIFAGIFCCMTANVFKEISGTACEFDMYEIPWDILSFALSYAYYHRSMLRKYYIYFRKSKG